MKPTAFVFALLMVAGLCQGQVDDAEQRNAPITLDKFHRMAAACAPGVPLVTLRAIVRVESAFHPYALSLNYPLRIAREHGLSSGGITLARQPRTRAEALAWTRYLLNRGRSVSVGLMQINTEHAAEFGLTVDQLFDPCMNVRVGAHLLTASYQAAVAIRGEGQEALHQALSEYNSGSAVIGVANGYVNHVIIGELYWRQLPQ
jgi:type IV secretion system protein VirB1